MKLYLHALMMCQSMFCAIPCPCRVWDEKARGRMLVFLPLVGLEIGLLWAGLAWLADALALPPMVRAFTVTVWPLLATGGIHLDGLMDAADAVKSWRTLEQRREILKDPHAGAFGVIGCCTVLLAQFAAAASLGAGEYAALALIPVASRCCSGLAVTVLPPMSASQYAANERPRGQVWALGGTLVAAVAAGFALGCGGALLACAAGYALTLRRCCRSLEGMSGDIAGCCLTVGETVGLLAYVCIPR